MEIETEIHAKTAMKRVWIYRRRRRRSGITSAGRCLYARI